jgi:hypothetical protein
MYALIVWAVIAGTSGTVHKDWRVLVTFGPPGYSNSAHNDPYDRNKLLCLEAAKGLRLKDGEYVCVRTLPAR